MGKHKREYQRRRIRRNMPEEEKLAYRFERIRQLLKDEGVKYIRGVIDVQDAITYLYGGILQRFQESCEVSSDHISKVVAPAFMKHDKIKHDPGGSVKILKATLCNSGSALPLIGISAPDSTRQIKSIDVPQRTKTRDMARRFLPYDVNLGHKWIKVNSADGYEKQYEEKKLKDAEREEEKWSGKGKFTIQTGG